MPWTAFIGTSSDSLPQASAASARDDELEQRGTIYQVPRGGARSDAISAMFEVSSPDTSYERLVVACLAVKPVGKPRAGNGHDGLMRGRGKRGVGQRGPQATAILHSTSGQAVDGRVSDLGSCGMWRSSARLDMNWSSLTCFHPQPNRRWATAITNYSNRF